MVNRPLACGQVAPARAGNGGEMGKLALVAVAVLIVIVLGAGAFFVFWDVPAPSSRVEHVIPDAKLAK